MATTDPQTILAMAEDTVGRTLGIAARDWFALDVDGAEGERTLERLKLDLPATLENGTRRGRHLIFRARLPFRPPATLGPGLDVKGNFQGKPTGYLLAPTSIVAGHVYRWRNDCEIALRPP